jgi:ParB-like nuclease domain
MKIELRKLSDIKPYPQILRVNDDAVAASIREFGVRQPIVVDTEDVIVVDHTRWKAAQKLGLDKVPVHVATNLTPAQIKAYRIPTEAGLLQGVVGRRAGQRGAQRPRGALGRAARPADPRDKPARRCRTVSVC